MGRDILTLDCYEEEAALEAEKQPSGPNELYEAAIDTLESTILSQAAAGVDVGSISYRNAIRTTLDGITNNYA